MEGCGWEVGLMYSVCRRMYSTGSGHGAVLCMGRRRANVRDRRVLCLCECASIWRRPEALDRLLNRWV